MVLWVVPLLLRRGWRPNGRTRVKHYAAIVCVVRRPRRQRRAHCTVRRRGQRSVATAATAATVVAVSR